ncbi:MAG: hypothetical protein V7776_10495 [Halopseudomonas aestusnigri]
MLYNVRKYSDLRLLPAVVWLIAQLLMTGFVGSANATPPVTELGPLTNQIVICTPTGFKTIQLSADGSIPISTEDHEQPCSWCMGFAKTVLPSVSFGNVSPSTELFSQTRWYPVTRVQIEKSNDHTFSIRGPPLNQATL